MTQQSTDLPPTLSKIFVQHATIFLFQHSIQSFSNTYHNLSPTLTPIFLQYSVQFSPTLSTIFLQHLSQSFSNTMIFLLQHTPQSSSNTHYNLPLTHTTFTTISNTHHTTHHTTFLNLYPAPRPPTSAARSNVSQKKQMQGDDGIREYGRWVWPKSSHAIGG
jgi:hypothetical protein